MKLIVGLGNPGDDYKATRHNIGFMAIDALVKFYDAEKVGKKFKSICFKTTVKDEQIFLIKPQTFMNLSGESVQLISSFYKIKPEDILVIYDDFDLDFPTMRLRKSGSAGTHNGMRSIVPCLGTKEFPRLRLGIGPKPEFFDISRFVLSNFSKEEQDELPNLLEKVVNCVEALQEHPVDYVMNRFNRTG